MATRRRILREGTCAAILFLALGRGMAQAQVTFTATLSASGTEMNKSVTENKAFRDNFPKLRREGNQSSDCVEATRDVCLPAECDIDPSRTYTTVDTRPHIVAGGYGRGGPGYGVVMNSVITRDSGGSASHQLINGNRCLRSKVRVCSRRFFTGASYEAYHEIYGKCATRQPWKKTQAVGPFTLNPGPYTPPPLATYNPPAGTANGIQGTSSRTSGDIRSIRRIPRTPASWPACSRKTRT